MKHRKRETGSGVSSSKSNIARAMRVRMPKIQENFAPQELPAIQEVAPEQQIIIAEVLIAPPPTNNQSELTIPSTSAPAAALQQVRPRATKRTRKVQNIMTTIRMIHLASQQTLVPQILFNPEESDGQAMLSQYNLL